MLSSCFHPGNGATRSSETPVDYQRTTRHCAPEYRNPIALLSDEVPCSGLALSIDVTCVRRQCPQLALRMCLVHISIGTSTNQIEIVHWIMATDCLLTFLISSKYYPVNHADFQMAPLNEQYWNKIIWNIFSAINLSIRRYFGRCFWEVERGRRAT
jgi:hypothetical protein